MLTIDDIKKYDITTPIAKKDVGINSKSTDAYTWIASSDKPFDSLTAFVYQGSEGVMLWAPTTGAATSSVHRTRTELKGRPFLFSSADVHKFHVTSKMHKINWLKSIVVMQIHCQDGNDPTSKTFLFFNSETKTWQLLEGLRTEENTKDPKKELLLDNIDIESKFTISYSITKDGLFTVEASQGGNKGVIEKQLSKERASREHVFHLGVYNQQDMGDKKEPAGDGSLIELMDFSEYHGNLIVPRTLQDVANDVQAVVDAFKASEVDQNTANSRLNDLQNEVNGFGDSEAKGNVLAAIEAAKLLVNPPIVVEPPPPVEPPVVIVPPVNEYEAIQMHLDALELSYYDSLKLLQTSIKTELNKMTEDMKSLTDKDKLSSLYVEIKQFKDDMALGMTQKT